MIKAHANGLRLGEVIAWERLPRVSGPKAGIRNPHPAMPWDEWIDPAALERDFCMLRDLFKVKLKEAGGPFRGVQEKVKERYWRFALGVLKESDIDWSGLRNQIAENAGTARTADEEAEIFFCDEDFAEPEPWGSVELKLGTPMLKTLEAGPGRLEKEGEAAYLAYVVLAALLNVEPTKVRDSMEHHKKKLRKEQ